MTLFELSRDYRDSAAALRGRIVELRGTYAGLDREDRIRMDARIRMLTAMWREARDLAVLCERYYDGGYRRNGKYTI